MPICSCAPLGRGDGRWQQAINGLPTIMGRYAAGGADRVTAECPVGACDLRMGIYAHHNDGARRWEIATGHEWPANNHGPLRGGQNGSWTAECPVGACDLRMGIYAHHNDGARGWEAATGHEWPANNHGPLRGRLQQAIHGLPTITGRYAAGGTDRGMAEFPVGTCDLRMGIHAHHNDGARRWQQAINGLPTIIGRYAAGRTHRGTAQCPIGTYDLRMGIYAYRNDDASVP